MSGSRIEGSDFRNAMIHQAKMGEAYVHGSVFFKQPDPKAIEAAVVQMSNGMVYQER